MYPSFANAFSFEGSDDSSAWTGGECALDDEPVDDGVRVEVETVFDVVDLAEYGWEG